LAKKFIFNPQIFFFHSESSSFVLAIFGNISKALELESQSRPTGLSLRNSYLNINYSLPRTGIAGSNIF
jgi:hypothetical protein